jgi:hypothetical protein
MDMMTSEKVLTRQALPNGLTLEFWDLSKPTAGDRWQVVVEVRLAIPVTPDNLPPELKEKLSEAAAALGSPVLFTKQEVRNFVAAGEVAELVKKIVAEMLASLQDYLGHPQFAPRFLRKKFLEFQETRKWYPDDQTGAR